MTEDHILGSLPDNWSARRLKYLATVTMGQSPSSETVGDDVRGMPFLQGNADFGPRMPAPRVYCDDPAKICASGDILLSVRAPVGALNVADQAYGIGRGLCAVTPREFDAQFLWYALHVVRAHLAAQSVGSTYDAVTATEVGELLIPVPPRERQCSISFFLDDETARIDGLIEMKRRLLELLEEKRLAVITHAVTKGLNPAAPMKDSGIDWLGEIPAHWEATPLSALLKRITYGFTNPMPTELDGPFMLTANDVDYGRIRFETARQTSWDAFQELLTDKSRPEAGDLLLTKDGTLGRVAVHDGRPACINQSVAMLRLNRLKADPDFMMFAMLSSVYQERMLYDAGGTTIKHIYITKLAKMPMALPPLEEQREVAEACRRRIEPINLLCGKILASTEALSELRCALITEAVTGKIDPCSGNELKAVS